MCPHLNLGVNMREGCELHSADPPLLSSVGSRRSRSHWGAVLFQCWGHAVEHGEEEQEQHVCLTCDVQHVFSHQSTAWQTTCSCARSFFFSPLAILILSCIFPITSDCKADEASWQMSSQIQTVPASRSVSLWPQITWFRINPEISESFFFFCLELVFHWRRVTKMVTLVCGPRRIEAKSLHSHHNCCFVDWISVFRQFHEMLHNFVGNFHFYISSSCTFPPLTSQLYWMLHHESFTFRWNSQDSQDFQETQPGSLSPWLERTNK